MENCELCSKSGGDLLWSDEDCRVVLVEGGDASLYPGFCRVIWNTHVAEMSELPAARTAALMHIVIATEKAVRAVMRPDKINLAALGNMVPHLHWHVIPRWRDDVCFPGPIWATPQRNFDTPASPARSAPDRSILQAAVTAAINQSKRDPS